MPGKLKLCLLVATIVVECVNADFQSVMNDAVKIANGLGNSHHGVSNRGRGCVINWSYEGMMMGFEWKFMGVCTDSCTGETVTVFTEGKGGAVEHCFRDLMQKLRERNEL